MKTKKRMILLAAFCCVLLFAGCGGGGGSQSSSSSAPEKAGETYETGKFSLTVPEGWKAFPVPDMWSDEEGAIDDSSLNVYKGAENELDMFSTCGVNFHYYEPNVYFDSRDLYDSATDISPVKAGENVWKGYDATMEITEESSYHYTILTLGEEDGPKIVASVLLENDSGTISLSDPDVMTILESVRFT